VRQTLEREDFLEVENLTKGYKFSVKLNFTRRQRKILLGGGLLNLVKTEIGSVQGFKT
jgi:hypothetical protein